MKVFIDGATGTTALQIFDRLKHETRIERIMLAETERKDKAARARAINQSDLTILCLADDIARESVSLIENDHVRVIDASTAHRTDPAWVYGFPEYDPHARARIKAARFVSNPGCYAIASIALLAPLIREGIIPADYPATIFGLSGYTGGGKPMIEQFEGAQRLEHPHFIYSLAKRHKHVAEIRQYSGLTADPVFLPNVGDFAQGMIVSIPLHRALLDAHLKAHDIDAVLKATYTPMRHIELCAADEETAYRLYPAAFSGNDKMELRVFENEHNHHFMLTASLDNLGKGAAGNAVDLMRIMFDMDE